MTDLQTFINFCFTFGYNYNVKRRTKNKLTIEAFGGEFKFYRDKDFPQEDDWHDDEWIEECYPAELVVKCRK